MLNNTRQLILKEVIHADLPFLISLFSQHFIGYASVTAPHQHIWSLIANHCRKPIEGVYPYWSRSQPKTVTAKPKFML